MPLHQLQLYYYAISPSATRDPKLHASLLRDYLRRIGAPDNIFGLGLHFGVTASSGSQG